jgi:serine/threonine protein kinase
VARDQNYIGSYRLLKLVRAGATCQIWEVVSEIDNRRCALKALQEQFRNDRDEISLLKHEFTVGKDLRHESVIEIYEFNVAKGIPFLALEFFDASNLKQLMRQSREDGVPLLPFDQKLMPSVIRRCASALGYLHDQGWVHRDVKPDNFLVNAEGTVKLIDFAIAQRIRKKGLASFLAGRSKVQGTRSYMSPEQIRGEALDARSDIYSFGCLLFEIHAGRPPYTGGNADQLLEKHLRASVPSLLAHSTIVTQEFSDLVALMMDKKPERRPASMPAVIEALSRARVYKR